MSGAITFVTVRFEIVGFHHWSGAPPARDYLASNHRHKFYIEVSVEVTHDDREIELHDLLIFCKRNFTSTAAGENFSDQSCEMIAKHLLNSVTREYGSRRVTVSVFEDGEVGAEVIFEP